MPIVAMNRMIPSWLTSGRSTSRSMAKATTAMTAPATEGGDQRQAERQAIARELERRTSVSAANSTIAPWAKLNTPDALKISTKPSATSE